MLTVIIRNKPLNTEIDLFRLPMAVIEGWHSPGILLGNKEFRTCSYKKYYENMLTNWKFVFNTEFSIFCPIAVIEG